MILVKNANVPYAARQALRMSFTHHPSSKEQPMLRDRNNNRAQRRQLSDSLLFPFLSRGGALWPVTVWAHMLLTYLIQLTLSCSKTAFRVGRVTKMASRTPIEMVFFISFAFLDMLRRNIKSLRMYFLLSFFLKHFNFGSIQRLNCPLGKYMNPYDVRKLTSRNLTYF